MSTIWSHACHRSGDSWHIDLSRVICVTTRRITYGEPDLDGNSLVGGTTARVTWVDGKESQDLVFAPNEPVEPFLDAWRQVREACL